MNIKSILSTTAMAAAFMLGSLPADAQETWKAIGDGMLRDDVITGWYLLGSYFEFPVEMQESEQTPGRYRLVNAYKNCPSIGGPEFPEMENYIVVDASDPVHVYIEPGCASYYIGQDQALCIWSMADDYYNNLYGNWKLADEEGICGTLKDGIVTFPRGAVLGSLIEDGLSYDPAKHDLVWMQVNRNGMFRLKLPGTPDTDITMSLVGMNDEEDGVVYDITFADDVEYVKIGAFAGEYADDMRSKVETDEVQTIRLDKSGTFTVPYDKDGIHTLVAVPYAGGRSYEPTAFTREWDFSEDEWKNVGTAHYVEAILSSNELRAWGFIIDEYEYDVQVEQSVKEPWIIRLVNPYGPAYPMATDINYDSSKRHDLYFDLTHYDCVQMLHNEDIGINLGYGHMEVRSMSDLYTKDRPYADRNLTLEEYMADESLPKCRYNAETKTIDGDSGALRILFPEKRADAWYLGNQNGHAKVVLPADIEIPTSSVEAVADDEYADPEYFTIDGMKADPANLAKGIYIVRQGKKVTKIFK